MVPKNLIIVKEPLKICIRDPDHLFQEMAETEQIGPPTRPTSAGLLPQTTLHLYKNKTKQNKQTISFLASSTDSAQPLNILFHPTHQQGVP